jgi:hypothetical protein
VESANLNGLSQALTPYTWVELVFDTTKKINPRTRHRRP